MCGTAALFLGCEVARTCPKRELRLHSEGSAIYESAFESWYEKASVRAAPRRVVVHAEGVPPFPPELVPIFRHATVASLDVRPRNRLLAMHLVRYLEFTAQLELLVVDPALVALANDPMYALTPEMRLDALRMVCDEAYHALFSVDLQNQVASAYGLNLAERERAWFLNRLDRLLATTAREDAELVRLLFVIISETLISADLSEQVRPSSAPDGVRGALRDHALDEGRHHAFFAFFLKQLWSSLDARQRQRSGALVPKLVDIFLRADKRAVWQDLADVGVDADAATEVVETTFAGPGISEQRRRVASRTLRYFADLDAFDSVEARESLHVHGFAPDRSFDP